MKKYFNELRKEYTKNLHLAFYNFEDPLNLFNELFKQAVNADIIEPNAMCLSTVSEDSKPTSRMVLMKSYDQEGIKFFSNYNSRKGSQIVHNKNVAALFYWDKIEIQIRIEGTVSRLSHKESDEYFSSRPIKSQVGTIVSHQSDTLDDRDKFIDKFKATLSKYKDKNPKRPKEWGGYLIRANRFEFWKGAENRLHHRIEYKKENRIWIKNLLQP